MQTKDLRIYCVETDGFPAIDKTLVVGWNENFAVCLTLEFRLKKRAFYSNECPMSPTHYCYVADLAGFTGAKAVRDRWNERDRKN